MLPSRLTIKGRKERDGRDEGAPAAAAVSHRSSAQLSDRSTLAGQHRKGTQQTEAPLRMDAIAGTTVPAGSPPSDRRIKRRPSGTARGTGSVATISPPLRTIPEQQGGVGGARSRR